LTTSPCGPLTTPAPAISRCHFRISLILDLPV
jgi:hypothetical protein